jgi:hypothetical protein
VSILFCVEARERVRNKIKMCNSIGTLCVFNIVIISVDGADGRYGLSA